MTQSGKTFVLLRFVNQLQDRKVIIVDTKHNINVPGFAKVTDPYKAAKCRSGKVIYRPKGSKPPDVFYQKVWDHYGKPRKANVTLVLDEAAHLTSPNKINEHLALLLQAGKENGCGVWWAGQQSTKINNTLISQSDKLLLFKIIVESDRKKIADAWGKAALKANDLEMADPVNGIGGEFMAFGFPEVEPIQSDGKVDAVYLRAS